MISSLDTLFSVGSSVQVEFLPGELLEFVNDIEEYLHLLSNWKWHSLRPFALAAIGFSLMLGRAEDKKGIPRILFTFLFRLTIIVSYRVFA